MMLTEQTTDEARPQADVTRRVAGEPAILIVSQDEPAMERLQSILREAGFILECAKSVTEACEAVKSGRFPVVVSAPFLSDGSWKRLLDVAHHYDLDFEVILLARSFDLYQWTEALKDGAFDVLDVLYDLPKAAEIASRAFGSAGHRKHLPPRPAVAKARAAAAIRSPA